MNPQTAQFFASLSHQWLPVVFFLTIALGLMTYSAGVFQVRARARSDWRGLRVSRAARVVSGSLLTVSIVLLGAAISHIGCASIKAHSTQCLSNLKQLGLAAMMYAQDYDERLPPASRWAEAIDSRVFNKNLPARENPFRCPAATSPASYGMNAAVSGLSLYDLDTPANLVFLFEADAPLRSFAGGAGDFARRRHGSVSNVVYADGHAKGATVSTPQQLDWTPKNATGNTTRPFRAAHRTPSNTPLEK